MLRSSSLLLLCSCSFEPQRTTLLAFEPLGLTSLPTVIFPDNSTLDGENLFAVAPEVVVRLAQGRLESSTDRGGTWRDISPSAAEVPSVQVLAGTLLIVERQADPWRIIVSANAGESWSTHEYDLPSGSVLRATGEGLVVSVAGEEDLRVLGLNGGMSRTSAELWVDPFVYVAPNGAAITSTPLRWTPLNSLVAWTPRFRPQMLTWDLDVLIATGLPQGVATNREVVGFTADSRVLVRAEGELWVSGAPLARNQDQRAEYRSGPRCRNLIEPNFGPGLGPNQNPDSVSLTNASDQPAHVYNYRVSGTNRSFEYQGALMPDESLTFSTSIGFPMALEAVTGECLEVVFHKEGEQNYSLGTE